MSDKDYVQEIEERRIEKNHFFMYDMQSPIPAEKREDFSGLKYYPVNLKYRFILRMHEHPEKKRVIIQESTGGTREYIIWGEFRFSIDGKDAILQAFKTRMEDKELWIPFKDMTNRKSTYGAGRYIDIHEDVMTDDGKFVLDFNLAYNPWCAYSDNYVCPLIPKENHLDIEIEAGEKKW